MFAWPQHNNYKPRLNIDCDLGLSWSCRSGVNTTSDLQDGPFVITNDPEGHNFSSAIYILSITCLEHHYCEDQKWRLIM